MITLRFINRLYSSSNHLIGIILAFSVVQVFRARGGARCLCPQTNTAPERSARSLPLDYHPHSGTMKNQPLAFIPTALHHHYLWKRPDAKRSARRSASACCGYAGIAHREATPRPFYGGNPGALTSRRKRAWRVTHNDDWTKRLAHFAGWIINLPRFSCVADQLRCGIVMIVQVIASPSSQNARYFVQAL